MLTQPSSKNCRRILVVDDSQPAANALSKLLEHYGHDVSVAYDGTSAIEKSHQYVPEIILLDIGLPGMSGYDVAKKIRENPIFSKTVIIGITGYDQDEDKKQSKEAGFDYHLIKPVSSIDLRMLLATI